MNLIDDDQLADLGTQKRIRILETPSINRALKVEVQCPRLARIGNLPSEGRLSDLARTEENHPRHLPQALFNDGAEPT
jgi:hypothetical protein